MRIGDTCTFKEEVVGCLFTSQAPSTTRAFKDVVVDACFDSSRLPEIWDYAADIERWLEY